MAVIKWESPSQLASWLHLTNKLDDVTGKEMQLNNFIIFASIAKAGALFFESKFNRGYAC